MDSLPLFCRHRRSSDDSTVIQLQNIRFDTSASGAIQVLSFHYIFRCFSLAFGLNEAYSVFSDIPTQSTIFPLLSEQNGKREEEGKKPIQ